MMLKNKPVIWQEEGLRQPPYHLQAEMHPRVARFLAQKEPLFALQERHPLAPVNIYFPSIFHENYRAFEAILKAEALRYQIFFTCKPCREPLFLREAAQQNMAVDVSSYGELVAALAEGVKGQTISATGPKNTSYLERALLEGCLIVLDGLHEWQHLQQLIKKHAQAPASVRVMLRLMNPQAQDVFGATYAEVTPFLAQLQACPAVRFVGFACHYSGADEAVRNAGIEQAVQATQHAFACGILPEALNIGGGYKVNMVADHGDWNQFKGALKKAVAGQAAPLTWHKNPLGLRVDKEGVRGSFDFTEHAEPVTGPAHLKQILQTPLHSLQGVSLATFLRESALALYIEPGRALLNQAGLVLSWVNFTRSSREGELLVNLMMNQSHLNAQQFKYMAAPVLLSRHQTPNLQEEGVYYYGALCYVGDFILYHKTYPAFLPAEGDVVAFVNTAAYRMAFNGGTVLEHPLAAAYSVQETEVGFTWQSMHKAREDKHAL